MFKQKILSEIINKFIKVKIINFKIKLLLKSNFIILFFFILNCEASLLRYESYPIKTKNSNDIQNPNIETSNNISFSLTKNWITCNRAGTQEVIGFSGKGGDWIITKNLEWVRVSSESGTLNDFLVILVEENNTLYSRTDTLEISLGNEIQFIKITQHNEVDLDGNGLIEIYSLFDLDNMRYNLEGTSYKTKETRVLSKGLTIGCPLNKCHGYELKTDIDLNELNYKKQNLNFIFNQRQSWIPIGECFSETNCGTSNDKIFTADFEGNSFVIKNLFIEAKELNAQAFFSRIGKNTISNIGFTNAIVHGKNYASVLAGVMGDNQNKTKIINSYAIGAVNGRDNIGGLVGYQFNSIIKNSFVNGEVSSEIASADSADGVGGLVGKSLNSEISNCYTKGQVNTKGILAGGLIGTLGLDGKKSSLTDSYSASQIFGRLSGGLIGSLSKDSSLIGNNIYVDYTKSGGVVSNFNMGVGLVHNSIKFYSEYKNLNELTSLNIETLNWKTSNWNISNSNLPELKYDCNYSNKSLCENIIKNQDDIVPNISNVQNNKADEIIKLTSFTDLYWEPKENAKIYRILLGEYFDSSIRWYSIATTTNTFLKLNILNPNIYYFQVQSCNDDDFKNCGNWGPILKATIYVKGSFQIPTSPSPYFYTIPFGVTNTTIEISGGGGGKSCDKKDGGRASKIICKLDFNAGDELNFTIGAKAKGSSGSIVHNTLRTQINGETAMSWSSLCVSIDKAIGGGVGGDTEFRFQGSRVALAIGGDGGTTESFNGNPQTVGKGGLNTITNIINNPKCTIENNAGSVTEVDGYAKIYW